MSHKRKGHLTVSKEYAAHLRKIGKRFYWSQERIAERVDIKEKLQYTEDLE